MHIVSVCNDAYSRGDDRVWRHRWKYIGTATRYDVVQLFVHYEYNVYHKV